MEILLIFLTGAFYITLIQPILIDLSRFIGMWFEEKISQMSVKINDSNVTMRERNSNIDVPPSNAIGFEVLEDFEEEEE